jgi:hypothetical protein
MPKDLQQEFLQLRMNKVKEEIAKLLAKHQLLLSAELKYTHMGIVPIIKLVERNLMSEEQDLNSSVEAPASEEQPAVEAAPEAEAPAAE